MQMKRKSDPTHLRIMFDVLCCFVYSIQCDSGSYEHSVEVIHDNDASNHVDVKTYRQNENLLGPDESL